MAKYRVCSVLILIWCLLVKGQEPDEACVRCLCHARSGCFFLRNCANYSISRQYWEVAGRPVVADDDPSDPNSYTSCMRDDNCVIKAIQAYVRAATIKDCNCDGLVDCKDFAAIHLKGDQCRSDFEMFRLQRLDTCLARSPNPPSPGWSMLCNIEPEPV